MTMWTVDDFPGADNVPWPLLIRARLVRDLDAFVATTVVHQVAQVASREVTTRIAEAAAEGMRAAPAEKVNRTARVDALDAVAAFIDICPPWPWPWPRPPRPPWPWPWPGPGNYPPGPYPWFEGQEHPWAKIGSPYQGAVLAGALDLVTRVGSQQLQEQLGGALKEQLGQL